jgi:hypothetical protein
VGSDWGKGCRTAAATAARALEGEPAGQFPGHAGKVERLTVRAQGAPERVGGGRPGGGVIAAGGLAGEGLRVGEPLRAQFVEADHPPFGGRGGIALAGVEGGQDGLDVAGSDAVSEGCLFMAREGSRWGALPPSPRSGSLWRPGGAGVNREENGFRKR